MMLVTGARGHIGNVLVRLLYEKGHRDLRLMVNSGDASFIEPYAKELVHCDICDAHAVDDAVRGCSDVFHLAGYIHMSGSDKQKLYDINVRGTENIVNACVRHGVGRLVYVSSIHALTSSADMTIDETVNADLSLCTDEYSRTKLAATLAVMDASQSAGLDAVTLFPTGVIGPYDYRSSMAGIMFKKYIGARGIQPSFAGKFDFVDVRDVAEGIYLAWRRGESGQGYILSGAECSIGRMMRLIGQCTGRALRPVDIPVSVVRAVAAVLGVYYRLAQKTPVITKETVSVMVSGVRIINEKAAQKLGFRARPLEETICDTVRWHSGTAQRQGEHADFSALF